MGTKAVLIAELEQAREIMRALLLDLEASHAERREVYPTWTVKELLAHITGWDDACINSLQAHARGEMPGTPAASGFDPFNASNVHERASLSLEQVTKEWELTRQILLHTIRDLPEACMEEPFVFPWDTRGTAADLVSILAEHEIEHAEEVRGRMLK